MRASTRSPTPIFADVLGRAAQMREHEHGRPLAVVAVPGHGLGDEIAVGIAPRDLEHGHGGQVAFLSQILAVAGERAVLGHLGEHALQRDARAALDAEGPRDLALPRFMQERSG